MNRARIWLTPKARGRLQAELTDLMRQRDQAPLPVGAHPRDAGDPASEQGALDARRERDARIRRLRQVLRDAEVGRPPDDGIAEPGMVVTVRFDDEPEAETFLLAHRDDRTHRDVEVCSPESPLGRALVGAREREQRTCTLPDGRDTRITVLRAVPYAHHP